LWPKSLKFLAQTIKAKIQWLSERFSNHNCHRYSSNGISIIFLMYMYNKTKCPQGFHRLKAKNLWDYWNSVFQIHLQTYSYSVNLMMILKNLLTSFIPFVLIQNQCHRNIFDVSDLNSKTCFSHEYIRIAVWWWKTCLFGQFFSQNKVMLSGKMF